MNSKMNDLTDEERIEKAAKAMRQRFIDRLGESFVQADLLAKVASEAAAPYLSQAERVRELEAELFAATHCEHGTPFDVDCVTCKESWKPIEAVFADTRDTVMKHYPALAAKVARLQRAHDEAFNPEGVGPKAGQMEEYNAALLALLTETGGTE